MKTERKLLVGAFAVAVAFGAAACERDDTFQETPAAQEETFDTQPYGTQPYGTQPVDPTLQPDPLLQDTLPYDTMPATTPGTEPQSY
jgi:hypothetical protein